VQVQADARVSRGLTRAFAYLLTRRTVGAVGLSARTEVYNSTLKWRVPPSRHGTRRACAGVRAQATPAVLCAQPGLLKLQTTYVRTYY